MTEQRMTNAQADEKEKAKAAERAAPDEKKAEDPSRPVIPATAIPTAKPDGVTSIAAESIPALIGGLHKRIDELEKAVHELTSHSIMRGIVPAESFLHRWYVKLRGML